MNSRSLKHDSKMPTTHYEFKLLTEASCPSTEELNNFFSSRKYSVWHGFYYHTNKLPTTKTLVNQALTRLQESITTHLNQGWTLQGNMIVTLKETKTYRLSASEIHSYDIISYSQALTKEESHEDYVKRKQTEQLPRQTQLEELKQKLADLQGKLEFISSNHQQPSSTPQSPPS